MCTCISPTLLVLGIGDQEPPLSCSEMRLWLTRQHGPPGVSIGHLGSAREAAERPRNDSRRGSGSTGGGVRAAHLGHDASLVHEEPAQPCGLLGDGVRVEAREAVPQRQVLGLVVFGCCLAWGHMRWEEKRSEEETSGQHPQQPEQAMRVSSTEARS